MSDLKATGMTLESIAGMPSSRPVNKESAQQERLNEIVHNSLASVAGGLGIVYTVLAISHIVGRHEWYQPSHLAASLVRVPNFEWSFHSTAGTALFQLDEKIFG